MEKGGDLGIGTFVSRRESMLGSAAVAAIGVLSMDKAHAASTAFDTRQLVLEWARCWTAHDLEGFLALFTDDAVYEDTALGHKSSGKKELRTFFEQTLVTFPDFKVVVSNAVADQHFGSGEWVMSGTFLGESFGQAPTGKSFQIPGCCFMKFAGQRIHYHCDYWNEPTFSRQVAP